MSNAAREPAVAGMFYPHSPADLERQVAELIPTDEAEHDLLACVQVLSQVLSPSVRPGRQAQPEMPAV